MTLNFATNRSDAVTIVQHLQCCDATFHPALSTRIDLEEYARKLAHTATRFEAWLGTCLVGLVAIYCNAPDRRMAFVSNVSVLPTHTGQGIGQTLMANAINHSRAIGFINLSLKVDAGASSAIHLYQKLGFSLAVDVDHCTMELKL